MKSHKCGACAYFQKIHNVDSGPHALCELFDKGVSSDTKRCVAWRRTRELRPTEPNGGSDE